MMSLIKSWVVITFITHSFFNFSSNASENTHPSYYDFLKMFPDGYPKFNEKGNPKSMGAFKAYLEDLGYITFDHKGNSVGFKFKINGGGNKEASKDVLNELIINQEKITEWVEVINFEINEKLNYPMIAKKRKQSGRVLVRISVLKSGEIVDVKIELSSNYIDLDKAAVATIQDIKKLSPAPFKANNEVFTFILPISFKLDNQQNNFKLF